MLMLERLRPDWKRLTIHESSPARRGVSTILARECPKYTASQFFPDVVAGEFREGVRCENIEAFTFDDEVFDIVITQDVMEHVFHPWLAHQQIYRVLRPGGIHLHTTPVYQGAHESVCRAEISEIGEVTYLHPPEYHGNPIDDAGSLVTFLYCRDLPERIAQWAPFSVEMVTFNDRHHGILGEFTEVIVAQKPIPITPAPE